MSPRTWTRAAAVVLAGLTLAACGSSSDEDAGPGPGEIFANSFAPGLHWEFFDGSVNAAGTADVDTATGHSDASWRIEVPDAGYVGGTVVADTGHDLHTFNALTFWAMASKDATLNVAGFGANQTASVPFLTERFAIALTTTWTKFVIPIPLPAKLTAERGLFHLAEGSDEGAYTIWLDDIRFETLPEAEIGTPAPAIATETRTIEEGATITVNGASVTYPSPGAAQTIFAGRRFFTWASSDETAATVDQDGVVTAVAEGTADITAQLGALAAAGITTVDVIPVQAPTEAAPTPTPPAADVISLYSNATGYTPVAMAFWSPTTADQGWDDGTTVEDLTVAGDDVMKFSGLGFSVSEVATPIDTVTPLMTHFHIDLWSATAGDTKIKLVDYGANGVWGDGSGGWPGDDVEFELTRTLTAGTWNALDIPLSDFTGLTTRAAVAQLVLSGANPVLFVDNVYFHK